MSKETGNEIGQLIVKLRKAALKHVNKLKIENFEKTFEFFENVLKNKDNEEYLVGVSGKLSAINKILGIEEKEKKDQMLTDILEQTNKVLEMLNEGKKQPVNSENNSYLKIAEKNTNTVVLKEITTQPVNNSSWVLYKLIHNLGSVYINTKKNLVREFVYKSPNLDRYICNKHDQHNTGHANFGFDDESIEYFRKKLDKMVPVSIYVNSRDPLLANDATHQNFRRIALFMMIALIIIETGDYPEAEDYDEKKANDGKFTVFEHKIHGECYVYSNKALNFEKTFVYTRMSLYGTLEKGNEKSKTAFISDKMLPLNQLDEYKYDFDSLAVEYQRKSIAFMKYVLGWILYNLKKK